MVMVKRNMNVLEDVVHQQLMIHVQYVEEVDIILVQHVMVVVKLETMIVPGGDFLLR